MINKPFAEVIQSSLQSFTGKTWKWDVMPSFGSLIVVQSKDATVFGIVHQIQTASSDPHRTVIAYQKTEEELKRDQPHIFEFLQTTFDCLTLGYIHNNTLYYQLAPEPVKIHGFIRPATHDEMLLFFDDIQYLHLMFNAQLQGSLDELLLALLKTLSDENIISTAKLEEFIQTFSLLTANDYRRLKLFLQRAKPVINVNHP